MPNFKLSKNKPLLIIILIMITIIWLYMLYEYIEYNRNLDMIIQKININ